MRFYKNRFFRYFIISNWEKQGKPIPPPHVVKQELILLYKHKYQCLFFVETGTYVGDMIYALKNSFRKLISVELSETLWEKAVLRFNNYSNVQIIQGDSAKILYEVTPQLEGRALFWLDGHFSGSGTAKGEKDCPILNELDAIFNNNSFHHIVLIDDGRLFTGLNDYPTLDELKVYASRADVNYNMNIEYDIISLTPKSLVS